MSTREIAGSLRRALAREDAATATEYAIIVSLIAAVCLGVVATLGTEVRALFSDPELLDAFTP